MSTSTETIEELATREYKYGFVTDIEAETIPKGLSEDVVRLISPKKDEPEWLLEWRLKAYRHWLTMKEPTWQNVNYDPIDYQDIIYYSAPKKKKIAEQPGRSRSGAARDLREARHPARGAEAACRRRGRRGVRQRLGRDDVQGEAGRAWASSSARSPRRCSEHPELVQKYLGSVVPHTDNFFAALNSAVFSDGSFVYIPKGVRCPMELSTYFRINAKDTGQFERTLIIADEGALRQLPRRLHRADARREPAARRGRRAGRARRRDDQVLDGPELVPRRQGRQGRHLQLRHQARHCRGRDSKISWTQVETGSAITWKYPSCILQGDNSIGEFYSVALTNNYQQADTGTKMIHIGQEHAQHDRLEGHLGRPRPEHLSRPGARSARTPTDARNYSQCDSLLIGDKCGAHTFPYLEVKNTTAKVEHEASTSKIGEDQIFYCRQRGISTEDAVNMIVNGFCKEVFRELPMEFAVEAQKLLERQSGRKRSVRRT